MKKTINTYKKCSRCGGLGKIAGYEHVSGGACFGCSGEGKIKTGEKTVEVKTPEEKRAEYVSYEQIMKECEEFDYSTLMD